MTVNGECSTQTGENKFSIFILIICVNKCYKKKKSEKTKQELHEKKEGTAGVEAGWN